MSTTKKLWSQLYRVSQFNVEWSKSCTKGQDQHSWMLSKVVFEYLKKKLDQSIPMHIKLTYWHFPSTIQSTYQATWCGLLCELS